MEPEELVELAAAAFPSGDVSGLCDECLKRRFTVAAYVFDLCLNELEARGMVETVDGVAQLPYDCDLMVETMLTRPDPDDGGRA